MSDLQARLQEILAPAYRIDRELGGAGMSRVFVVIASPGTIVWSRDSRHAFFSLREKDGTSSIWQLPFTQLLSRAR